jgi:glycosyltransferase involved in cell wall biosynthesis
LTSRVLGQVEQPNEAVISPHRITHDRRLFVSGWAFAINGAPLRVRARIGDAEEVDAPADTFRDDVATDHSRLPHAGRSGFGILVPLPERAGESRLCVEASYDGEWIPLAERILLVPEMAAEATPEPRPQAIAGRRRPAGSGTPGTKRVLFASHNFNLEGAPLMLFDVAKSLDLERYELRVVSPSPGPLAERWLSVGIPAEPDGFILHGTTLGDYQACLRRTAALQRRLKPDLLVANTLDAFWAVELAQELAIPSIWIIHESVDPTTYFHERWPTAVAERAAAAFQSASRVVFVAEATRQLFSEVVRPESTRVLHNGADLREVDAVSKRFSRERARRKLGIPSDKTIVTCVGTTCQRKGQLVLLEALAQLEEEGPAPYCVLVGARPGPYLDVLHRSIDRWGLGGLVRAVAETPEPYPYYRAADIAVCPSFQESLPLVVMEAMAFGLPVVASSIHGIPELIRHDQEGMLFAPGDAAALGKALAALQCDPARAAALGAAGRQRIEEEFTLEQCVARHAALLDEVLREA